MPSAITIWNNSMKCGIMQPERQVSYMEIRYLKEFTELAEVLNFTTAAENLYISQPVLSKHIRALEKELGEKLFNRGKILSLTRFGAGYLEYAAEIVEKYEASEDWRKKSQQKSNLTMLIGLPESLMLYEINEHLHVFSANHPEFHIETMESLTSSLVQMYKQGIFKIFLTGMTASTDPASLPYKFLPVARGEIKVCVRKDHALAAKREITVEDLRDEKVVIPPHNTLFQEFIEDRFYEVLGFYKEFRYSSYSIAKTLAESGSYVALLQQEAVVSDMPDELVVKRLVPPIAYVRGIGYHPTALSEAEKAYIEFVRSEMGEV